MSIVFVVDWTSKFSLISLVEDVDISSMYNFSMVQRKGKNETVAQNGVSNGHINGKSGNKGVKAVKAKTLPVKEESDSDSEVNFFKTSNLSVKLNCFCKLQVEFHVNPLLAK